jgi:hypothetical protein
VQVATPEPAWLLTAGLGAAGQRGLAGTRAAVGRPHRRGSVGRRWRGRVGPGFAQRAGRSLGEPRQGAGRVGPLALPLRGCRWPRWLRGHAAVAGPHGGQQDPEPTQSQKRAWVGGVVWHHDRALASWGDGGPLEPMGRARA